MGSVDLEHGISLSLEPGEKHELEVPITFGNYWVLCKSSKQVVNMPVSTGSAVNSLPGSTSKLSVSFRETDETIRVFPFNDGRLQLRVTNDSARGLDLCSRRRATRRGPTPLWFRVSRSFATCSQRRWYRPTSHSP